MEFLRFLPFAIAAFALLIGAVFYLRNRSRLRRGRTAAGRVVGWQPLYHGGTTNYAPQVQFPLQDGRTITFVSQYGVSVQPVLGHPVDILYDPAQPERAELRHNITSQHAPLVCAICAVVFSVGGLPLVLR